MIISSNGILFAVLEIMKIGETMELKYSLGIKYFFNVIISKHCCNFSKANSININLNLKINKNTFKLRANLTYKDINCSKILF